MSLGVEVSGETAAAFHDLSAVNFSFGSIDDRSLPFSSDRQ
jgi:hypothetical protein